MRLWWLRAPWAASGAGAPGCGHPSGWPAADGRGAWGWSARAAGSIRRTAAARGGARPGSDHARPAAGPAHPASGAAAAGVSASALTCPSRIAQVDVGEQLAGRGDLGDVARLGAAAGDDGVPGLVDRGADRGTLDRLDQRPAQR